MHVQIADSGRVARWLIDRASGSHMRQFWASGALTSMHCVFDYELVADWTTERPVLCHRQSVAVPPELQPRTSAPWWLRLGLRQDIRGI